MKEIWPVRLFSKSVLKQTKHRHISNYLGATDGLHCLDVGSDNGVFSYLLRQRGGTWKSADLDERSVRAMKELVETEVYRINGAKTPFEENEFDRVVIVDYLEHIQDDVGFIDELYRILKPGGTLILNAPNIKTGLLMKFRALIGLTEEAHGHLRPGYTLEMFQGLLGDRFELTAHTTYTKFFSKFLDTMMVFVLEKLKRKKPEKRSGRGVLVTGKEMREYQRLFRMYSLIYPFIYVFSQLDRLLFASSGYMLIAKAYSNKTAGSD